MTRKTINRRLSLTIVSLSHFDLNIRSGLCEQGRNLAAALSSEWLAESAADG